MDESFPRPQWIRGRASRQAHADLPEGTVEEEHGREGFSGAASHLYRLRPPTGWTSIDGPLRPHALDANRLDGTADGGGGPDGVPGGHARPSTGTSTSSSSVSRRYGWGSPA